MDIVFDAGGVLLEWKPGEIAARVFPTIDQQQLFLESVLPGNTWRNYDAGLVDLEGYVHQAYEETALDKQLLRDFVREAKRSLVPKVQTLDLMKTLKALGYRVFVLSNMPADMADYLLEYHDFWQHMDGTVFSGYVQMAKPDREIFSYIIETWSLEPGNTIFIDDMSYNTEAAAVMGMKTVLFHSADECRQQLKLHGIKI